MAAPRMPARPSTPGTAIETATTRCIRRRRRTRTICPACSPGRWPHVHFEVYPSLDAATSAASKIATSQIALPEDICTEVYATSGYESSRRTFSHVSLASDNVFGDDGGARELGTMSGSI